MLFPRNIETSIFLGFFSLIPLWLAGVFAALPASVQGGVQIAPVAFNSLLLQKMQFPSFSPNS